MYSICYIWFQIYTSEDGLYSELDNHYNNYIDKREKEDLPENIKDGLTEAEIDRGEFAQERKQHIGKVVLKILEGYGVNENERYYSNYKQSGRNEIF